MVNGNGSVAIVTGAGSGIGRATAMRLAKAGHTVVLVGRTLAKLHETIRQVEDEMANPPRLAVQHMDITDPHAVDTLIDATVESFGHIDALVNVAGYASLKSVSEISPDAWRKTVDTNLSSVVYLTQAAWSHLARADNAIVVNVSSMASKEPFPGLGLYAAAKIGVNMLTKVTANEGKDKGIRAVAVAPGAVETPMLRDMFDTAMLPEDKTLTPDDVASLITACITGERSFEPGETIFLASP